MERQLAKVLVVDDELRSIRDYIEALRVLSDVDVEFNIDSAFAKAKTNRYDLILLDLMMPPGDRYSCEDSNAGLLTGLLFLRDLRSSGIGTFTILLTNSIPIPPSSFLDDPSVLVRDKTEILPHELAELVVQRCTRSTDDLPSRTS